MTGQTQQQTAPAGDKMPTGKIAEELIEHQHIGQDAHTAPTAAPKRTVLVALDNSPNSQSAFQWALENFIREGDLVVLTTVREPVLVPGAYGYMDFGDYIAEAEEQSRLKAHALVKRFGLALLKHFHLPSANAPNSPITVKGIVMRGDPRDELVRKADELQAAALIVGSRGLGAFKRAFLGSCSDYIVHHSAVPVIIVKHE